MTDIVERLLWRRTDGTLINPIGPEAADEIERLRAALDDVPKAIRIAAASSPYSDGMTPQFNRGLSDGYEAAAQVAEHFARAALGEKP